MRRRDDASARQSRFVAGLFLAIALPAALLFATFTPPFRVPDEVGHFWRAYALASGHFNPAIAAGGATSELPASMRQLVKEFWRSHETQPEEFNRYPYHMAWRIPLDPPKTVAVEYPGQYVPTLYAPQMLASAVCRTFEARPLVTFYAGRLAALLFFVTIVFLAIRITPVAPWAFAVAAMLPTSLFLAASWSADSVNNALAFLFTALMLRAVVDDRPMRGGEIALLAFTGFLLATGKPYVAIALVLLAVPAIRFRERRGKLKMLAAVAIPMTIGLALSLALSGHASVALRAGVDPGRQMANVAGAPFQFIGTFASDLARQGTVYLDQMIGRFGMLNIFLPPFMKFVGIALLLLAASTSLTPLRPGARIAGLTAVAMTVFAISLALYLGWTPLGSGMIEGVQGRYFIALLPVTVAALSSTVLGRVRPVPWILGIGSIVMIAWSLYAIQTHYFVTLSPFAP